MLPWAISRQVRVGMLTPRRLAIRRAVSSRRAMLASNKCRVGSRISAGAVFRRAGVERRFRRVFHVKLYAVGSVFTAQPCCNVKRAIDPRGDPGCKDHITVHHHSLVDGHSAKERREMMHRPVGGRLPAFDQTRRTANQHAGADGENALGRPSPVARIQPSTSSSSISAS